MDDLDDSQMQKKKIVVEEKERRIFLYNMNSFIPYNLINLIRKNEKNKFSGTISNNKELPKNFKPKIITINPESPYTNNDLFENNYFICSLDDSKYSEIEYIIKGLKAKQHDEEKYLILVSNIMTWARTPPKIKKENNEENNNDMENEEVEEGEEKEKDNEENKEEEQEEDDVVNEIFEDAEEEKEEDDEAKKEMEGEEAMETEPVSLCYFYLLLNFH